MIRRGIAATAAIALTTTGIGLISVAAVAADKVRYLPASEIVWTNSSEEETANYNVWHYDPSSTALVEQVPNGFLVNAGERALIAEGNGNDVVQDGGQPVDDTSIADLATSLDLVTSHPDLVHYQIPVFYDWGEEDVAPKYTTLRKQVSADDSQWVSSAAIDSDGDGTPDIARNTVYDITEIVAALEGASGGDATPIAAGFLVDKVSVDVLISSFTANGEQVKFYEQPEVGTYTGEASTLVHQQIRPDETEYNGWHQGHEPARGEYVTVMENGVPAGLKLTGDVQILNGLGDDLALANALELAPTLQIDVVEGSSPVWSQIPIFAFQDGALDSQFTTFRAQVPASGNLADAASWVSSRDIKDASGEIVIARGQELSFEDILSKIDSHEVIGYGFLTSGGNAEATVRSVTFDGVTTSFYQMPAVWEEGEEYVPLEKIIPTSNAAEETEHYNEWHFDPSSTTEAAQNRNGIVVPEGERALIVEGNRNDLAGPTDALADTTAIPALVESLDIVTSNDTLVHYQIPLRFDYNEENGSWNWATLRQRADADNDMWISSRAIGDIKANTAYPIDEIVAGLNSFGDARVIAAGFIVDKPSEDVLVSSFSAKDTTTYFYEVDEPVGTYDGDDEFIIDEQIRPNEDSYPGWHDGHTADGTYTTIYRGPQANGIELEGTVQLINGFEPENFIQNGVDLAYTLEVDVATGDDPVFAQIPIYYYPDGSLEPKFTTIRTQFPETGTIPEDALWTTSWDIVGSDGSVLIDKNTEATLPEIREALGKHDVLAYGILTWESGPVVINSITFDRVTTSFVGQELAVTPEAPSQSGDNGETITIPTTDGVEYLVEGEVQTEIITLGIGDSITVTARATEGYVIEDGADTEWTFNYINTVVEAEAPTQDSNVVTIPTINGVEYVVDGEVVTGTVAVEIGETVEVTARAVAGYELAEDSAATWSFAYVNTVVETEAPSFADNTITIPVVTGVEYLVDGDVVTGTVAVEIGETVEVTARAVAGYELAEDSATTWSFAYVNAVVETEAPSFADNTISIPEVAGVQYLIDGEPVTGDITLLIGQTVEITARAIDGYELDGDAAWTFTYVDVQISATEPTFDDNTITIPVVTGVEYLVDGEVVTGEVDVPVDSTVTVTAQATTGYLLVGTTSWDFDYVDVIVTPVAPSFADNTISIPEVEGVQYLVDGEVVTEPVAVEIGETVTVSVQPVDGYAFEDDATASWSFTYVNTVVETEAPSFADNTISIPEVAGVEYLVDGEVVTGDVSISEDTTVTARAIAGYVLAEDAVVSWDFEYVAPIIEVTPVAPSFADNTITIPEVTGVEYLVDGDVVTGTVAVEIGETVEVTARAVAGYELAEDSDATWSFTYVNASVAAVAPTQLGKTVTIPNVDGVEYLISGKAVTGTYDLANGQTVTVTARALPGYDMKGTSSWKFSYTAVAKGNIFYILNSWDDAREDFRFAYGRQGDEVFVGDWDGDGYDTLAVRRGNHFFVNNELRGGNADMSFKYGRVDDEVLVGDWDGDGKDTFGIRRGNAFHLKNSLAGGNADTSFNYGRAADEVFIGDWDGDKKDTVTVRRGNTFHVNNSFVGGNAARSYTYGRLTDDAIAGDWDGDGKDTISLRRGNTYIINNGLIGGNAGISIRYGRVTDNVIIGDWNGDGIDTIAVNRYVG